MIKKLINAAFVIVLLAIPGSALAQDYYFQNPQKIVHVYWNEDGTESLQYALKFINDPGGHPIEYVDLGLPNNSFDVNSISAQVDGNPINFISRDEFQGTGSGVALGLGSYSIPPGQSGTVIVTIGSINRVLYPDDNDDSYASGVFSPAYFIPSVVYGQTDLTVVFHLPPGVQPDEPRWHASPSGFNSQPETGFDDQGRITYIWHNPNASPSSEYKFGASFPVTYVPEDSIVTRNLLAEWFNSINFEDLIPFGCIGAFVLFIVWGIVSDNKRKMQYLSPKIKMEGQGIKRGLTAVEAAVLLEQPLDKVLTMILFSVIKKSAVRVTKQKPLSLEFANPQPDGLRKYETEFIDAFRSPGKKRQKELQEMVIDLVKTISNKMRGFSGRETKRYYQSIMEKAWEQVEAADTPEVRSQKYDDVMEWTMLDRDYEDRTRDVFRGYPVFIPHWWGSYDPTFRAGTARTSTRSTSSSTSSGSTSLPNLPGGDFAASIVNGVQTFSAGVVGNINEFTSGVTQKTNPVPVSKSSGGRSSGGGGSSCACACACAGCACACAGGGR